MPGGCEENAILLLDYDTAAPDLNRSIRVLKMRGSAHSTEALKLQIRAGGLNVEKMSVPPGSVNRAV